MKGDDGATDLIGGKRIAKDHPLVECLGTIDELNAFLGDAKTAMPDTQTANQNQRHLIEEIQKELFIVSGIIAGSMASAPNIEKFDALIKSIESQLQPPGSFAVPGANVISAKLHIARTVCRRLERRLVGLNSPEIIPAEIYSTLLAWFNRLSDLLFLLAQAEDSGIKCKNNNYMV